MIFLVLQFSNKVQHDHKLLFHFTITHSLLLGNYIGVNMSWESRTFVKFYKNVLRSPAQIRFMYNFDPATMTPMMKKYISKSNYHLDIGVASVDDIIYSEIENKQSINISLLDYTQAPLDLAKEDLISNGYPQSNIETICCDILKLNDTNQFKLIQNKSNVNKTFDSISMIALLSSVEGPMNKKLPAILDNLSNVMDEETVLFGFTMFTPSDDDKSFGAKVVRLSQRQKKLFNQNDSFQDVQTILNDYFDECIIDKYEYHVVFQVKKFKKNKRINDHE